MFIESTFMRYGHGQAGIVGITLKPETLKTWALSRHVCSQLMEDLAELRGESDENKALTSHKEEGVTASKMTRKAEKHWKINLIIMYYVYSSYEARRSSRQFDEYLKWHYCSTTGQC